MRNAIPRECEAKVLVPQMMKDEFLAMVEKCKQTFMEEYKDIETKGFLLTATQVEEIPQKIFKRISSMPC